MSNSTIARSLSPVPENTAVTKLFEQALDNGFVSAEGQFIDCDFDEKFPKTLQFLGLDDADYEICRSWIDVASVVQIVKWHVSGSISEEKLAGDHSAGFNVTDSLVAARTKAENGLKTILNDLWVKNLKKSCSLEDMYLSTKPRSLPFKGFAFVEPCPSPVCISGNVICPDCNGQKGEEKIIERTTAANVSYSDFGFVECTRCDGAGQIACPSCNGTSTLTHKFSFHVQATPFSSKLGPETLKGSALDTCLEHNYEVKHLHDLGFPFEQLPERRLAVDQIEFRATALPYGLFREIRKKSTSETFQISIFGKDQKVTGADAIVDKALYQVDQTLDEVLKKSARKKRKLIEQFQSMSLIRTLVNGDRDDEPEQMSFIRSLDTSRLPWIEVELGLLYREAAPEPGWRFWSSAAVVCVPIVFLATLISGIEIGLLSLVVLTLLLWSTAVATQRVSMRRFKLNYPSQYFSEISDYSGDHHKRTFRRLAWLVSFGLLCGGAIFAAGNLSRVVQAASLSLDWVEPTNSTLRDLLDVDILVMAGLGDASIYRTTAAARLREQASTSSAILAVIPKDTRITKVEEATADWYQVEYDDISGFVYANLLEEYSGEDHESSLLRNNESKGDCRMITRNGVEHEFCGESQ